MVSRAAKWSRFAVVSALITCCVITAAAQAPATQRKYRIIDLGTLGGSYSEALAINNKGQVVGESLTAANLDVHAFVWSGGQMTAIPGLGGGPNAFSRANDINNNGKVVGTNDPDLFPGDRSRLFLFDVNTGSLTFPANPGWADRINDAGQILGSAMLPSGFLSDVIISSSGIADLGALCGGLCSSNFGVNAFDGKAINASGTVVGGPALPPNHLNGYLYTAGTFVSIAGNAGFYGNAINNSNLIGGFVREQTGFFGIRARAASRQGSNGNIVVYGSFAVNGDTTIESVNNIGQMVGTERASNVRTPFLIENGIMIPLSSLLPSGSGWTLLEALDINDRGEIVGSGRINGEEHAFLLTPLACTSAEDTDNDGNPDNDEDGLCDSWEVNGVDGDGDGTIDLFLGTNPNRKDLFVEADYMVCAFSNPACATIHSHNPQPQAIANVIAAFANAPVVNPDLSLGITLHVQVDEAVPEIPSVQFSGNGPGVFDDFNDIKLGSVPTPCGSSFTGFFGTLADRIHNDCAKILMARQKVFRYAIFGHDQADSPGSSGKAEIGGNDFVVTVGGWSNAGIQSAGGSANLTQARTAVEEGTFMHEFGHTLGLRHGGGDNINCKPNYLSIMNYSFQFPDLVTTRPLDFSFPQLPAIDENMLDENFGIQGPANYTTVFQAFFSMGSFPVRSAAQGPIDWNRNMSSTDAGLSLDISNIAQNGPSCATNIKTFLAGFDDWSSLQYSFLSSPDFADGAMRSTVELEPEKSEADVLAAAQSFDFDGDGVTNFPDNCPAIANPSQQDSDGNGVGDACEAGPPADTTAPVLTLPANITTTATSPSGAVVNYSASALDAVDGSVTVNCAPPSGATFAIGTTTVNCTASDAASNIANGNFSVTVNPQPPPPPPPSGARIASRVANQQRLESDVIAIDVELTNVTQNMLSSVMLRRVTLRTTGGSGTVRIIAAYSPALPHSIGSLSGGGTATLRFVLRVPATVTQFTLQTAGTGSDAGAIFEWEPVVTIVP